MLKKYGVDDIEFSDDFIDFVINRPSNTGNIKRLGLNERWAMEIAYLKEEKKAMEMNSMKKKLREEQRIALDAKQREKRTAEMEKKYLYADRQEDSNGGAFVNGVWLPHAELTRQEELISNVGDVVLPPSLELLQRAREAVQGGTVNAALQAYIALGSPGFTRLTRST